MTYDSGITLKSKRKTRTTGLKIALPFFLLLFLVIMFSLLTVCRFASYIYAEPRVPFIIPLHGDFIVKFREIYFDKEEEVERKHTGIDISGDRGERIKASGTGTVSYIGFSPIGGRTIVIKHNEKIRTTYLNLSAISVSEGTYVLQGSIIASIGADDDPSSEGPHLHFGIIYDGKYLDPMDVLSIDYSSISKFISLEYLETDFLLKK